MLSDVQAQLHSWWAPLLAFAAGLVSFASPCVLPLVPGYLAFVTGQPVGAGRDRATGSGADATVEGPATGGAVAVRVAGRGGGLGRIGPLLLFVAGFTVVFTLVFGFLGSAASTWIRSTVGQRVAGGVVLAFGVFMLLYAFRLGVPWLYREERPLLSKIKPGPAWAFPLGMAFAAGWTPCIGPVLGGITFLAEAQGSVWRGVILLLIYSLGLGLPFVLVGMGIERMMGAMRFFSRNYHWIAGVSGVLMIVVGVLLISGLWVQLLSPVLRLVNRFSPPI